MVCAGRAVALGRGLAGRAADIGPAVVVDQVKRGNLVETVVASGHVETPYRAEIGSQITGTVEDVLVRGRRAGQQGPAADLPGSARLKAA